MRNNTSALINSTGASSDHESEGNQRIEQQVVHGKRGRSREPKHLKEQPPSKKRQLSTHTHKPSRLMNGVPSPQLTPVVPIQAPEQDVLTQQEAEVEQEYQLFSVGLRIYEDLTKEKGARCEAETRAEALETRMATLVQENIALVAHNTTFEQENNTLIEQNTTLTREKDAVIEHKDIELRESNTVIERKNTELRGRDDYIRRKEALI